METNIDFIAKLYNNSNSYADIFTPEELNKLHVSSKIEDLIKDAISKKKIIYLTGNPGDGKTHLIKATEETIKKYNAFVIYDINEVKDYKKFIADLKKAVKEGRPCIIAINEYPLIKLFEEAGEQLPYYNHIIEQRDNSIIYNNIAKELDLHKVLVIDLNNRNLLSPKMTRKILKKILELSNTCIKCPSNERCYVYYNIKALSNEKVQQRLLRCLDMIGSSGIHVVMRDILGFFSYIITAGRGCSNRNQNESKEDYYYNLVFKGDNELFKRIREFDAFNYTHPEIDEKLWKGTLDEGWLFTKPNNKPVDFEFEDAIEEFKSNKRKFYFEHIRGEELLQLIPIEYKSYYNLLVQSGDRELEVIKNITLAINRFFNPYDLDDDRLKVWTTHKYELRIRPKVAVSNRSFATDFISLYVPNVPKHLSVMEYIPDHFIYRVKSIQNCRTVDLSIDLGFYRVLLLIKEGYPSQLIPEYYQFKLLRFMNELASMPHRIRSNEFLIRDISNNDSFKVIVRNNKYIAK